MPSQVETKSWSQSSSTPWDRWRTPDQVACWLRAIGMVKCVSGRRVVNTSSSSRSRLRIPWCPICPSVLTNFVSGAPVRDGLTRIFELPSGELVQTLRGHTAPVSCVRFDPTGRLLITGSSDRTVRFWDVASGEQVRLRSVNSDDGVALVAFTDAPDTIVAADYNGAIHPYPVPLRYLKRR